MTSALLAMVLVAGLAVQPTPTPAPPSSQPQTAPAKAQPSLADELMKVKDPSLVPSWAVKRADRNAALLYMKAIVELPVPVRDAARELDWKAITMSAKPEEQPEAFRKAVDAFKENSPHWYELTRDAAMLERCDFETEYEAGVGMLLPHLGHLRNLARCLRVQARMLAIKGEYDQAAEALGVCMRMGAHVTRDRVLISTLVGVAITTVAVEEADALLAAGTLSPKATEDLRASIAAVMKTNGFSVREALETERDMFLGWFLVAMKQGTSSAQAISMVLGQEADAKVAAGLRAMDEKALKAEVERARSAYNDLLAVWDKPDVAAQLGKIGDKVQAGEYGLVAKISMPSFGRAQTSVSKGVAGLKALDERLAKGGK